MRAALELAGLAVVIGAVNVGVYIMAKDKGYIPATTTPSYSATPVYLDVVLHKQVTRTDRYVTLCIWYTNAKQQVLFHSCNHERRYFND